MDFFIRVVQSNLRLRVGTTAGSKTLMLASHPQAAPSVASAIAAHSATQGLRRTRHRSVERQLDDRDSSFGGADSALGESDGSSYERFSAAVFHHKVTIRFLGLPPRMHS